MPGFRNRQETGRPVTIKDEGVSLVDNVASIDFAGAGVSGTTVGTDVTETISSAGGAFQEETPSGTINGSNKTFTLSVTPISGSLEVYLNGAFQTAGGEDYTLSESTITFVNAPPTGSVLRVRYQT
jgi:hypothetical protein